MPRGDKSAYMNKQKRKAEHVAEGYRDRGVPARVAKARGWVGKIGSSHVSHAKHVAAGKKAARTRKKITTHH